MTDWIIKGGTVVDGTGAPPARADLALSGGQIESVGDCSDLDSSREWDATGKYVCPGFVDIHSHSDFSLLANRLAESAVRQGITTVVTGNCGHGPAPAPDAKMAQQNTAGFSESWEVDFSWKSFSEYLNALFSPGVAINVAPLVPHGTVRLAVMGYDARPATEKEIDRMKGLVAEAMSAGAIGLSTGLEYSPGMYAKEEELVALSRVAAEQGGIYASHIRNRGDHFESAVEEALNVCRKAGLPGQLSHLAPRPYAPKGTFDKVLSMVYEARDKEGLKVGIDTFPDTWGPGPMVALLPPWVYEGARDEVLDRLQDPETRLACRDHFESPTNYLLRLGGLESFYLSCSRSYPELVGKNFQEIAQLLDLSPVEAIFRLALEDGADFYNVMLRHIYATQEDLERLLLQPICSLESDGIIAAPYGSLQHFVMNRSSYGYTVRFIREYVLERPLFSLQEAIRKLTSLPVECAGIDGRGVLQPGMAADLVVLDLDRLADKSTDVQPQAYPEGVDMVAVNGEVVLERGVRSGRLPGRCASPDDA